MRPETGGQLVPTVGIPKTHHDTTTDYFVKSWLICGPFEYAPSWMGSINHKQDAEGFEVDYLGTAGGELNVKPALGMRHVGVDNTVAYWKSISVGGNRVNLVPHFSPADRSLAYAYSEIEADRDCDVIVGFGSDDSGRIYLNGEMVHNFKGHRGIKVDGDYVKVHLREGTNRVLLKIGNGNGGWGFSFHVTSAEQLFADPGRFAAGMQMTVQTNELSKGRLGLKMGGDRFKLLDTLPAVSFDVQGLGRYEARATETLKVDVGVLSPGIHTVVGHATGPDGGDIRCETWFFHGDIKKYYKRIAARAATVFPPRSPARISVEGLLEGLRRKPANHGAVRPALKLIMQMLEDAEAGVDPLAHKTGPRLGGYWSEIDGTPRWYPFYVPDAYDPETPMPLLVQLHGYDAGNRGLMDGYWERGFHPPGIADKEGVIVLYGFGRGNTDYWSVGHNDVMRAIEGVKSTHNIDENRIYMAGGSMGGTGTWNIGTREADMFAALAPDFGRADFRWWLAPEVQERMGPEKVFIEERCRSPLYMMDNLYRVPCIVHHGELDPIVVAGHSRASVAWIKRIGGTVEYKEHIGKKHGGLGNAGASRKWMLQHERDPNPRRVKLRTGWLKSAQLYWVAVDRFEDLMEFVRVDAEITGEYSIRLTTENVAAITLTPVRELLSIDPPLEHPITVEWNDNRYVIGSSGPVRAEGSSSSQETIRADVQDQSISLATERLGNGLCKTRDMEGPIEDVYCGPFTLVQGTIAQDEFTKEVVAREIEKMAVDWEGWQHARPRVMLDTDITDYHIDNLNLVLVGGPTENDITRRIMQHSNGFPLEIRNNTLRLGEYEFNGDDLGIAMCYPNPLNPDRYVLILAGTTWKGVYQLDAFKDKDYDYMVVDDRSQCHPPEDEAVLLKGYFNHLWQVDERYARRRPEETGEKALPRTYPKYLDAHTSPNDEVYLSDVVSTYAKGDFARAGHDLNWFQQPIQLGGETFDKGLSTFVAIGIYRNDVFYDLDGQFSRLKATVGIEIRPETTLTDLQWRSTGLVFYVIGDGKELFKSKPIGPYDDPVEIDVPLHNVEELWLKSFNKGAWHVKVDSVDWGGVRVIR